MEVNGEQGKNPGNKQITINICDPCVVNKVAGADHTFKQIYPLNNDNKAFTYRFQR